MQLKTKKKFIYDRLPYEMNQDIDAFNENKVPGEQEICNMSAVLINRFLPEAENKIWHGHLVWFLEGNPIGGYSKLKAGIRLMF